MEYVKSCGEENASLIGDDLATILSDNANMVSELETRDNTINTLKQDKENLITANGNLFKQVSLGIEETPTQEDKHDPFDFRDAFDKNGNFI